jgi:hypothetical protein
MDGTRGTDLGVGTLMQVWVGILGIVLGVGIHGTDVLIWVGVIISTTAMCIMATTGIITIGIVMDGTTEAMLPIQYTVVAKADRLLLLQRVVMHLQDV